MAFEEAIGGIDLHVHSTASDGSFPPAEVMEMAARAGLKALALTDHDTVSGVRAALALSLPDSMTFVPGVELSVVVPHPFPDSGVFHLLAYFIDPDSPQLGEALAVCRNARRERNPKILERLNALGVNMSFDDVARFAPDGQVGRPHFAQALVSVGAALDIPDAFRKFLAKGSPAYVPKFRLSADEALAAVTGAGGLAVLAHPSSLGMDPATLKNFLIHMKDAGLSGIEAIYPSHSPETTGRYLALARELDLCPTGGTDFHGAAKPDVAIGVGHGGLFVPFSFYEELSARRNAPKGFVRPPHSQLEARLGYRFSRPEILTEALTHSSHLGDGAPCGTRDNQRLEFLGDAVLGLCVAQLLMERLPDADEGQLTRIRAALVSEKALADLARSLELGPHIVLSRGEAGARGYDKNGILADCFEAVTGAMFQDGGADACQAFVNELFSPLVPENGHTCQADHKTRLQEVSQRLFSGSPRYEDVAASGPSHNRTFVMRVNLPNGLSALGTGRSKKAAEQNAAKSVLSLMEKLGEIT